MLVENEISRSLRNLCCIVLIYVVSLSSTPYITVYNISNLLLSVNFTSRILKKALLSKDVMVLNFVDHS